MGSAVSKPAPPDVDLLPPKFDKRPAPLEKLPLSPMEYMFGQEKRDKLFTNHFVPANSFVASGLIRPDYEEKAVVAVHSRVDQSTATAGGPVYTPAADVTLGYDDMDASPMLLAQARLGTDGSARALLSGYDLVSGVGAYALLPGEFFVAQSELGHAEASRRFASAEVGRGLRGPAVRYTDLKPAAVTGTATGTGQNDGGRLDPVSPRAVTAAASAGAAAPEAGTSRAGLAASPLLPEFGIRYTDATETVSAGVHASPFAPYPTKAWLVGTANGTLNAGMQVATTVDRLRAKPGTGKRVDVSFAASIAQPPLFELSLSYDGARREVVAGFVQSMTVRRKCHNLFEEANVKGIYNYVDLGFELRRALSVNGGGESALAVGASWQVNKNLLLKGRVGSRESSASLAWKSWWDPSVTLCATSSYDHRTRAGALGVSLHLEKGGALEYQKAVAGYQSAAPSMSLAAQPQMSQRMTTHVDATPLDAPPPSINAKSGAIAAQGRQPGTYSEARSAAAQQRPPSRFL